MYLERYHQVKISPSDVWRILRKAGVNRLPASQRYKRRETRWKRYEKQRPGHQLQVDVKFKGIGHVRIRPRTPRLNGKVERSHRIDSEEFYRLLEGEIIDDARLFETRPARRPPGVLFRRGDTSANCWHECHPAARPPPGGPHLIGDQEDSVV
ncbi:hypothetical protein SAMN04488561_4368 [Jiangella alba]|uniref:Integrase catalytic domain-containing protein n=1 Tax=Jiangella alba TaxID=561176 RepID=A0A1H5PHD2_9ACTN|nr:hypothetical protein SAMN04488561_4368 [Jiangella alba]